jgi:hypothetical protein
MTGTPTPGRAPPTSRFGLTSIDRPLACVRCSYNLMGLRPEDLCPECSTPIATSCEAAFRPAQHDPRCRCCGYQLQGLPPDARCPECEYPVEWSLGPARLSHLSQRDLDRLRVGLLVVVTGCFVLVLARAWWFLHETNVLSSVSVVSLFGLRGTITMWRLLDAAGASLIAIGAMQITHRGERPLKNADDTRSRRLLHAGAFLCLLISTCWYSAWAIYWHLYVFGTATPLTQWLAAKGVMLLCLTALTVGAALRTRLLATLIPARNLATLGAVAAWTGPAAFLTCPCIPVVPSLIATSLLGVQVWLLARRVRRIEPAEPATSGSPSTRPDL